MRRPVLAYTLALWSLLAGAFSLPARAGDTGNPLTQCQGESFKIDLLGTLDALPDDTPDAQLDQIRDWVWTTVLARIAAKSHQPELLASIARQPLFRDDSLSHLLDQPVGRTRSAVGKDGTVYVLVQRSAPQQTFEDVLEAVDQAAFYLGTAPKRVQVYGVDLKMETAEAEVCKLATVEKAWLQAPEQGFRHAQVTSADQLAVFLDGGVDLLAASCRSDKKGHPYLEVSGRHRTRDGGAPVTVAHVAAVSQKTDGEEGLGFSLDPNTDVSKAISSLDQLIDALPSGSRVSSVLESWEADPKNSWLVARGFAAGMPLQETREALVKLKEEIQDLSPPRVQEILLNKRESPEDPVLASLADAVLHRSSFQRARYDGPVEGTEAAMTMFYTDFLAKLWTFDWKGAAPSTEIPGFQSVVEFRNSQANCDDDEDLRSTRIWFGARHEGFLRERSGLRLSPNATRIFALGSNLGVSREEEPSSSSLRFIRWWDRHYAELATWEPQYELLNQLVKWTLARRMAELMPEGAGCLDFLAGVDTGPKQHFQDWVAVHPNLRWRGPVPLIATEPTETLPLLESRPFESCGRSVFLEGGVSLPPQSELAAREVADVSKAERFSYERLIDPEKLSRKLPSGESIFDLQFLKGRLSQFKVKVKQAVVDISSLVKSDIRPRSAMVSRELKEFLYKKKIVIKNLGNRIEATESTDRFGVQHLEAEGVLGTALKVDADLGTSKFVQRAAQEISSRLQPEGGDLKTIVKTVCSDCEVFALQHDMAAIGFVPSEGSPKVYAILASGDGIRGPPPPLGDYMVVGATEPRPRGSSGGIGGILAKLLGLQRDESGRLSILLLPEKDALPYIRRLRGKLVDPDPKVQEVIAALREGDIAKARRKAQAEETPEQALVALSLHELNSADLSDFKSTIDRLLQSSAAPEDFQQIQKGIVRRQIELNRQGDRTNGLALTEIQGRIAIETSRLLPRETSSEMARGAAESGIVYLPENFSDAALPPSSYPPGKVLDPDKQFITVLVDKVMRRTEAPTRIGESRLRDGVPPVGPPHFPPGGPPDPGRLEMVANRNSDLRWPLVLVVPCSTGDEPEFGDSESEPKPSCYQSIEDQLESPEAMARLQKEAYDFLKCDADGDGKISDDEERDCVTRAFKSRRQQHVEPRPIS